MGNSGTQTIPVLNNQVNFSLRNSPVGACFFVFFLEDEVLLAPGCPAVIQPLRLWGN